jgi:hypothetical protein
MTKEEIYTAKKEFISQLQENFYEFKDIQSQSKEVYESNLKDWIQDSLLNYTKHGELSFTFLSRYELSESFAKSIGPISLKLIKPVYVESPISCGSNILIGYRYNCDIKHLILL